MASTLSPNSFLLVPTPHSRRINPKNPSRVALVFAQKSGAGAGAENGAFPSWRFGKPAASEESKAEDLSNSPPFSFDFSKFSDVTSLIPAATGPSTGLGFGNFRRKDPNTVFVAGAAGQVGIRTAQKLLRQGFNVRAGVPDLGAAQELARLAAAYKIISNEESKRLNAVESSFEDAEAIAKAIGNAGKVVVTIGPAEQGPASEVTTSDALQVIQAAQLAGVGHVAIIYDGSASSSASTYNVLDGISSFFNNLFSRSQSLTVGEFLQKVVETDVRYTLIKTRLTEDFSPESSYNIVVSPERSTDVTNDYKVAKSQIASLVADVFSNTEIAEDKVVRVFTDPSAPSKPVNELFGTIPEDGRRKAYAEALAKSKADEEAAAAAEKARQAEEKGKRLENEAKNKLREKKTEAAEADAAAAAASIEGLFNKAKDLNLGFSWDKLSSQIALATQKSREEEEGEEESVKSKVQVATVRGQAKARNLLPKKAVLKQKSAKPPPPPPSLKSRAQPKVAVAAESKTETRKFFGGLFQQETIYVDDE